MSKSVFHTVWHSRWYFGKVQHCLLIKFIGDLPKARAYQTRNYPRKHCYKIFEFGLMFIIKSFIILEFDNFF